MINITTLNNGLTVATDQMDKNEVVSIRIAVKTGSVNETKKQNGISHILEHMAFKGTNKRNTKQIAIDFDSIGGSFNAYTSATKTVYYGRVLKEYVEDAFEILTDILQNPIYEEGELTKEKSVILQELAMSKDTPDDMAIEYYMATAYPNQPFGRPIIGTEKNIKNTTRNDLLEYTKKRYTANNIIVAFAGDINHEESLKLVEKYITKLDVNNKLKNPEKIEYKGGYFKKEKKLEQTHCIIGLQSTPLTENFEYIKIGLLSKILGGGMSSRLFQEVREKRGLCYTVFSSNNPNKDTGDFSIYTAVEPEKTNEAINAIIEETKKLLDDIHEDELKRAKIKIKSSLIMGRTSESNRSANLISDLTNFGRNIDIEEIKKAIDEVKIQDLKIELEKILNSTPTVMLYGKVKDVYDYNYITNKINA